MEMWNFKHAPPGLPQKKKKKEKGQILCSSIETVAFWCFTNTRLAFLFIFGSQEPCDKI